MSPADYVELLCVVKVVTRDPCSNNSISSSIGLYTGDDYNDVMAVAVKKTALRVNRVYIVIYKTICYLLFRAGGPLVALIVLNSRLLKTLRHQKRWRSSRQILMTSRVSAWWRDNVTAMLVTVVTVFIICELPDPALRLVYASVQLTSDPSEELLLILRYVNAVTNALLVFNSAVNFVIYFLVGRTFRRVFIGSLGCCPAPRRPSVVINRAAAAAEAAYVDMTTPRRRHAAVVKETEARAVVVATDNSAAVTVAMSSVPARCCHNNDRDHVTVVAVDVER